MEWCFILGIEYMPILKIDSGIIFLGVWDGSGWWKILLVGAVIFFSTMSSNDALKDGNIQVRSPDRRRAANDFISQSSLKRDDCIRYLGACTRDEGYGGLIGDDPFNRLYDICT